MEGGIMRKHINIPIFIPHEGCPNDCIFCNQRKISGSVCAPTETEIHEVIEKHLKTAGKHDFCEIAFFGGSFTGLPVTEQEKYLSIAFQYVKDGRVNGIRLSTRPDYINEQILSLLKEYSVIVIELGIQSLDTEVLRKSKRFYTAEEAIGACQLIKHHDFALGVQTMIGLPGDTFEKSLKTAKRIIDVKPDMVRLYPTLVIRGTELEKEFLAGNYKPLSLEETISWCSKIIPLYEDANIRVLRIGLQYTESLGAGNEVVAGPAHPALGELVYSQIYLNHIVRILYERKFKTEGTLIIHVAPSEVSMVIGQHRRNINILKNTFGFSSVKVVGDLENLKSPRLDFLP
jgi:histone acetyltransferase (RNA polymerase elongator complex component)